MLDRWSESGPRKDDARMAFGDPTLLGPTAEVFSSKMVEDINGYQTVGHYVAQTEYKVNAGGYMYMLFYYNSARADIKETADVSSYGRYFCFFIQLNSTVEYAFRLTFVSTSGKQSFTDFKIATNVMQHLCFDTLDLSVGEGRIAVDFAELDHISVSHTNAFLPETEHLKLKVTLLYFSDIDESHLYSITPAVYNVSDELVQSEGTCVPRVVPEAVPAPVDCSNNYEGFKSSVFCRSTNELDGTCSGHEWALYRLTDSVPAADLPKLAYVVDDNGVVVGGLSGVLNEYLTAHFLSKYEGEFDVTGFYILHSVYSLPPGYYISIYNQYQSLKLLDEEDLEIVDVSDFGNYFCWWMEMDIVGAEVWALFITNATHNSYGAVQVTSTEWTEYCIDVRKLQVPNNRYQADLTKLMHVQIVHTNTGTTTLTNIHMKYTQMYFSDDLKMYSSPPAVFNPLAFFNLERVNGKCEYVIGPETADTPPNLAPPKTLISAYTRNDHSSAIPNTNRLAIWVLDGRSHWIGMAHGLKTMGVPFTVTEDLDEALQHRLVIVYPYVKETIIPPLPGFPADVALSAADAIKLRNHMELDGNDVIFIMSEGHSFLDTTCGVEPGQKIEHASYIYFNTDIPDAPTETFTCAMDEADFKPYVPYPCETANESRSDTEKFIKIWDSYLPGFGNSFEALEYPVSTNPAANPVEMLALFVKRYPIVIDTGTLEESVYYGPDPNVLPAGFEYKLGRIVKRNPFDPDTPTYSIKEELTETGAISKSTTASGGHCYNMGFDLGSFTYLNFRYQLSGHSRSYSNEYEPGLDMMLRFIRNVYFDKFNDAVTYHPIPNGHRLAVMFTHDCDANRPDLWRLFSRTERQHDINATFMIFTKYTRDAYDVEFFFRGYDDLMDILDFGHELGSHSVTHSPNFYRAAPDFRDYGTGNGQEQFNFGPTGDKYETEIVCTDARDYFASVQQRDGSVYGWVYNGETITNCSEYAKFFLPVCAYQDDPTGVNTCGLYHTLGGSVMGELRVSKFLVDRLYDLRGLPDHEVRAFRPGHLKYPPELNEALQATGYRYSSVMEANEVNTMLYYQQTHGYLEESLDFNRIAELPDVFELPIQFDDFSYFPLRASAKEELIGGTNMSGHTWVVSGRMAKFGAIVVVLSHPTDEATEVTFDNLPYTGIDKLEWEIELVERIRDYSSFMTMTQIGDFIRARNFVEVDFVIQGDLQIKLQVLHGIRGLTLEIPIRFDCSASDKVVRQLDDLVYKHQRNVVLSYLEPGTHTLVCSQSRLRR